MRSARVCLAGTCVLAAGLLIASCDGEPMAVPMLDSGPPGRGFAEPCTITEDCESNLCLTVTRGSAICTRTCSSDADCPVGENWGCILPDDLGARICGCSADADEEICGDGIDNECNGLPDDCRICDGRAVPENDPEHCGECGNACRVDQSCVSGECLCAEVGLVECDGVCVDTENSADHCGACGSACPTGQECTAGACACPAETPEYCDGVCVDPDADSDNCGTCGNVCGLDVVCVSGMCECTDRFFPTVCPGAGCVDLNRSRMHCGACDNACRDGENCESGACECPIASQLWCEGACRNVRGDTDHCGACGNVCRPGEWCSDGTCECPSGVICDGVCVPAEDSSNCGGCGVVCRADQSCRSGSCECLGSTNCGSACVDTTRDSSNCGACGTVCASDMSCLASSCVCTVAGAVVCASTGGCTDILNDPAHCGACDLACAAAEVCTGGSCQCPTSTDTYCPLSGACESLDSDTNNCGACGAVCPPAQVCSAGTCSCPIAGQTLCPSGSCEDLANDPSNCGGCGVMCPAGQVCSAGVCGCASASATYCSASSTCADLRTDVLNCGACGTTCPAETYCSFRCLCTDTALTLCGGTECVNLRTDPANCGGCGVACSGGSICTASRCVCPPPTLGTESRLTVTLPNSEYVRTATDGSRVAVAWSESINTLMFTIVDATGTRTITDFSRPAASLRYLDVAWSGTEWGVIWSEYFPTDVPTHTSAMFQRFASDGTPIGTAIDVSAGWGSSNPSTSRVSLSWAGSGSGWGAAIAYPAGVNFQRIPTSGPLPFPVLATSSSPWELHIAGAPDGRFGILWNENRFRRIAAAGSLDGPEVSFIRLYDAALGHDGQTWVAVGSRTISSGGTRYQVAMLRGDTFSYATPLIDTTVWPGPRASHFALSTQGDEIVTTWSTALASSVTGHTLTVARARGTASPTGAATMVVSPTVLHPMETVSTSHWSAVEWTSATDFLAVWPDIRWGQRELYTLAGSYLACR